MIIGFFAKLRVAATSRNLPKAGKDSMQTPQESLQSDPQRPLVRVPGGRRGYLISSRAVSDSISVTQ